MGEVALSGGEVSKTHFRRLPFRSKFTLGKKVCKCAFPNWTSESVPNTNNCFVYFSFLWRQCVAFSELSYVIAVSFLYGEYYTSTVGCTFFPSGWCFSTL